jgi:hypothetical protein
MKPITPRQCWTRFVLTVCGLFYGGLALIWFLKEVGLINPWKD